MLQGLISRRRGCAHHQDRGIFARHEDPSSVEPNRIAERFDSPGGPASPSEGIRTL